MKKSLWISVAVLSLAVSAMAEPPTPQQGGRLSIFAPPVTPAGPLVGVVSALVTALITRTEVIFRR